MFCRFWIFFAPGTGRRPAGWWERLAQRHQDACRHCRHHAAAEGALAARLKRDAAAITPEVAADLPARILGRLPAAAGISAASRVFLPPPALRPHPRQRMRLAWAAAMVMSVPLFGGGLLWNLAATRQARTQDALSCLTVPLAVATACVALPGRAADEPLSRETRMLAATMADFLGGMPEIH